MAHRFLSGKKYLFIVILSVAAFTVIFGAAGVMRYRSYTYPYYDFALNIQKYWNIIHADGRMSLIGDVNIWGNSLEVIAYPLGALYFLLFSSPEALLVLQALMIALGAIPIFLIARMVLSEKWSACIAVSYLLHPALWFMVLGQYYDMTFCSVPLAFAFYFLKKDNFRWFIACIILSISFRADIALTALMFGVYAMMDRKKLKWVMAPILISVAWLIIGLGIIRPIVYPKVDYETFYRYVGGSFSGSVGNLLAHPLSAASAVFTQQNAVLVFQLILPVLLISVFAVRELSICFPTLLQRLFSGKALDHTIKLHYSAALLPFIYISAIYGLSRIISGDKGKNKYRALLPALILIVPVVTNLWYGPMAQMTIYPKALKSTEFSVKKSEFVRSIPKDASVISTFNFSSHLANRKGLYSFHFVTARPFPFPYAGYRVPDNIEYAMIDFADSLIREFFLHPDFDIRTRKFLEDGKFGVVDSFDTIVLFKRGYTGGHKLYEANAGACGDDRPMAVAGGKVALIRYEIKPEGRYLKIKLSWQCLDKIEDDIWMVFQILDSGGKEVYRNMKPMCFGIYPITRWAKGERVIDNYNMLLPKDRINGGEEYDMKLVLKSAGGKNVVSVLSSGGIKVEDSCRLSLGKFKL